MEPSFNMKVAFIVIFVFLSSVHIDQIRADKLITYFMIMLNLLVNLTL